jgi:ribosome-associated protein
MKAAFSHIHVSLAEETVDELRVTDQVAIPMSELDIRATRSQGAGGQNVNKVESAVHLRFDIAASPSLPERLRARLLASGDSRITTDGVIVIKAQEFRTQDRNRRAALERLSDVIRRATVRKKKRIPTKPSKAAKAKRRDNKSRRGSLKKLRGKPGDD